MIINAYKVVVDKPEETFKDTKSEKQIIKEVANYVIKEESSLIEKDLKDAALEKIVSMLYSQYHITEEKTIKGMQAEIMNRIFGYGILQKYIDDINVSDIRVVAFNNIYIKKLGKWNRVHESFETNIEFEEYVRFCALKNNANINFETPIVVFSDRKNSLRIEAGIEPANVTGPSLVIRIHRKNIPSNIEKLFIEHNMLDKESYKIIKEKINPSNNIILCGKGGSGKTTLLKAFIERLPKEVAITTNEETAEFFLQDRNVIQRECIVNRSESKNVDLDVLSRHSLVMSNDVIIIGELKGKEANSFFDSISTGHTGLATVHADSAQNAIDRLITLIKKDVKAQYYTETFLKRFLSSSIDYIIFMKDFKVHEIIKVEFDDNKEKLRYINLYKLGDLNDRNSN